MTVFFRVIGSGLCGCGGCYIGATCVSCQGDLGPELDANGVIELEFYHVCSPELDLDEPAVVCGVPGSGFDYCMRYPTCDPYEILEQLGVREECYCKFSDPCPCTCYPIQECPFGCPEDPFVDDNQPL